MELSTYQIPITYSVKEAIEAIEAGGKKVVFITDEDGKLLGLFSDGDMRKYILNNGDLSLSIANAMNHSPSVYYSLEEIADEMKKIRRVVYPILDVNGVLIDAVFINDIPKRRIAYSLQGVPLVIMAGGQGVRLQPFTNILPKALIPIGDVTITERIIKRFLEFDCDPIYLVLNHKRNMIKAYFSELNYNIEYIDEQDFLGTGGGLALLKNKVDSTFFVSNCDILIDTDYSCIHKFHKDENNLLTFVCAIKNSVMPYGVITLDEMGKVMDIIEKPSYSFLTNTGLYALEPAALDYIEENEFIHITDLAKRLIERGQNVGVYPISEKCWLDMGQFNEMENMLEVLGES